MGKHKKKQLEIDFDTLPEKFCLKANHGCVLRTMLLPWNFSIGISQEES